MFKVFVRVSALTAAMCTTMVMGNEFLLETPQQKEAMREAVAQNALFTATFEQRKSAIDSSLNSPITVPVPKDAGGGYTHEVHKRNYAQLRDLGRLYTLTRDTIYKDKAVAIFNDYAALYPTLGPHPKKKEQSPGRLFWQSLNEAVWLVYAIQGYADIREDLTPEQRDYIESRLFVPMANFLSDESPQTFNKVHNHGTWATAAVGMAGLVLEKPEWVEKALLGLDLSGKGGFLRQLDQLFSPQGYYNEGPYYQRYALMPFVLFAQALDINQPQRRIFEYRDGILLKAIETTIQLSYAGLFFPINDAIKDKGIDTVELVHGVAIAYNKLAEKGLLDIARQQDQILLTGYGLAIAEGLENQLAQPYVFQSKRFGDGAQGEQGALIVMRDTQAKGGLGQALVFKATSQGLGHGHFDKLNIQFYDNGNEILTDYGAARYLNVEAKYGGHYLPENKSYAKQTVAHNTLVIDETSHFKGKTKTGNRYFPLVHFVDNKDDLQVAHATMNQAYEDASFTRTVALVSVGDALPIVIDVLDVVSTNTHQYDLPFHYAGQLIDSSAHLDTKTQHLAPLGKASGYEHLWLKATGEPKDAVTRVTWLKDNRFYSLNTLLPRDGEMLFTELGANDPNFNLRRENAVILRQTGKKQARFVSLLEPHGEYNGSKEFTLASKSQLIALAEYEYDEANAVVFELAGQGRYALVWRKPDQVAGNIALSIEGQSFELDGNSALVPL